MGQITNTSKLYTFFNNTIGQSYTCNLFQVEKEKNSWKRIKKRIIKRKKRRRMWKWKRRLNLRRKRRRRKKEDRRREMRKL